jgi:hypothetical protein
LTKKERKEKYSFPIGGAKLPTGLGQGPKINSIGPTAR